MSLKRLRRRWMTLLWGVLPGLAALFLLLLCRRLPAPVPDSEGSPTALRAPADLPTPLRAMWVARFHYHEPHDVERIFENCAALGMNTVFWQVRGAATVSYPSALEPWGIEYGHADPGWDPLQLAVEAARRHGLRIEAWFNVMPGWHGRRPPAIADHVYHTHPDWFLRDAEGRRQPLSDFYVILNPCRADVRAHIAAVAAELMSRYELDGLHLDYVRYAWDETPQGRARYPRDPETMALFAADSGLSGPDVEPARWDAWRADRLRDLVAAIRAAVDEARPGAAMTAAVWNSPRTALRDYLQDGPRWLREGLLDGLVPMAYTRDSRQFEGFLREYAAAAGRNGRVIPGVGAWLHTRPETLAQQLDFCRGLGGDFALFAYESYFPAAAPGAGPETAATQSQRDMRRTVLRDALAATAAADPTAALADE